MIETVKTAGIVGGHGPETTSDFYMKIVEASRNRDTLSYPHVVVNSSPVPFEAERSFVEDGESQEQMYSVLESSCRRLEEAEVDFIAIPCNTLHIFTGRLRNNLSTPILSIIERTARKVNEQNFRKVGILSTEKTAEENLYGSRLSESGIETLKPNEERQRQVTEVITRILEGEHSERDNKVLQDIVGSLSDRGAQAVILGCTDLQVALSEETTDVELLDTVDILAEATVQKIWRDQD